MKKQNFKCGKYQVKNTQKTNSADIVYRSSYELKMLEYLDVCPGVTEYTSENVKISYMFQGKAHNYYPDFCVEFADHAPFKAGKSILEIATDRSLTAPKPGASATEYKRYIKNMAKWQAAKAYCDENNMKFLLVTEWIIKHL
jgi:hypothetical protein